MRDTIAAIATATGGGVGMVRLSGPQALAVAGRLFRPLNTAKTPETMPGYTGAFGRVYHGDALLDEAVLFVYHAPHSYTGEDVAEGSLCFRRCWLPPLPRAPDRRRPGSTPAAR